MRKLVLFDIDGTLVLTGGAGIRAMNRACETLANRPDALTGIAVAGRTDRIILADVVARTGRPFDDDLLHELRDRYVTNLAEEILLPGRGLKAVMPGVPALLEALQRRGDAFLGLLTGNFEAGARLKLEHFGLWHYFACGAYGDDAADRNALVPFALARARQCGLPDLSSRDVLVVGDTPHDVACAHAVGAFAVAVATGGFSVDDLRVTGADVVLRDLSETEAFLALLANA